MEAHDFSDLRHADLLSLAGRVAVVTGAARGIGLAIARRLAGAGATCILTDADEAESVAATTACGEGAEFVVLDVRDQASVEVLAAAVRERHGRLDIWVNNAGVFPRQDPLDVSRDDIASVLDVNVVGVQIGCQAAVRQMRRSGGGVIINVASTAAYRGTGAYSASKWAVRGLTLGLAPVVGPHGIRVVAVAPSLTETAGLSSYVGSAPDAADLVANVGQQMPLGRLGLPDDVARVALFLASDAAGFITGQTVVVDGGSLSAM